MDYEKSERLLSRCGLVVMDLSDPIGQTIELEKAKQAKVPMFIGFVSSDPLARCTGRRCTEGRLQSRASCRAASETPMSCEMRSGTGAMPTVRRQVHQTSASSERQPHHRSGSKGRTSSSAVGAPCHRPWHGRSTLRPSGRSPPHRPAVRGDDGRRVTRRGGDPAARPLPLKGGPQWPY